MSMTRDELMDRAEDLFTKVTGAAADRGSTDIGMVMTIKRVDGQDRVSVLELGDEMNDPRFKAMLGKVLRAVAREARAVFFLSDIWTVGPELDTEARVKAYEEYRGRLQDCPDRAEAMMMTASAPCGELMLQQRYQRSEEGIELVGEVDKMLSWEGDVTFGGHFLGLYREIQ